MKLPRFFVSALVLNITFAGLYLHQKHTDQERIKKTEALKIECATLEQRAKTLITQLNSIKERSALEEYARNNLDMEKIDSNQKRTVENI